MPYIGKSPSGVGVRTRYLYTATASQTTFSGADTQNLTLSYTSSTFIDVHQNGVLLKVVDDYTATSGSSIVLATGATADDVIEITVFDIFTVANHIKKDGDVMTGLLEITRSDTNAQLRLTTTDASATEGPVLELFRNSDSPADSDDLGVIRFIGRNNHISGEEEVYAKIKAETRDITDATEDGYIDFSIQVDSTLRNMLEIGSSEIVINEDSVDVDFRVESNGNANMLFVDAGNDRVGIAKSDPAVAFDVTGTGRFSAGVLFGTDTAAVNTLDDYEEGTFTPSFNFASANASAGSTVGNGRYVKIGSLVTVYVRANNINVSGASGDLQIGNLPFTSLVDTGDGTVVTYVGSARVNHINYASNASIAADIPDNSLFLRIVENLDNAGADVINASNCSDGQTDVFACVTYPTAS